MPDYDIGWSMSPGGNVYPSPDFNLGALHTPSMNQGFNSLITSHTGAQQHLWNTGNHFHPEAPSSFNSTGFPNPDGSTGHAQQRQFSSTAGNNQGNIPPFGTQGAGGG